MTSHGANSSQSNPCSTIWGLIFELQVDDLPPMSDDTLTQIFCYSRLLYRISQMADPLSIAASALAIITATIQTTKSLYDTVQRFNKRNKTLRRLLQEIEDLTNILELLKQVIGAESSMIKLLQGPVEHCSQICTEFERSLEGFVGKSKTGLLDWTKLEFKRGDINEFIHVISGYKATISVGLATINL
jgi:hypothetical protein